MIIEYGIETSDDNLCNKYFKIKNLNKKFYFRDLELE